MKPDPTQILSPEDAEWRALLLAAKDLFQLAPWAWMGDAQHLGVRDPETGETGWCGVMGSDGELMGVAVYLGDEGYDFFRRLLSEDVLHDEGMFGQEALRSSSGTARS